MRAAKRKKEVPTTTTPTPTPNKPLHHPTLKNDVISVRGSFLFDKIVPHVAEYDKIASGGPLGGVVQTAGTNLQAVEGGVRIHLPQLPPRQIDHPS